LQGTKGGAGTGGAELGAVKFAATPAWCSRWDLNHLKSNNRRASSIAVYVVCERLRTRNSMQPFAGKSREKQIFGKSLANIYGWV
jgi:hypothetical protein